MTEYTSTTLGFGNGSRLFFFRKNTTDEDVMKQVFAKKQYNLGNLPRCQELLAYAKQQEATGLRPLVVDAGANIGASALYFIGNLPNALVVAVEPDFENFNVLSKNVHGLTVEATRAAISSTTGRARVVDPGRGQWAYRTQPVDEKYNGIDAVPRITLNDIYASHHSKYFPFIVKVDIEGAEKDLFSANTEWVAVTPIIIVELHDWLLQKEGTSRPFLRCMSELDRDFIGLDADVFSIANDLRALRQLFGNKPAANREG
jgi:FkbM family methyltransferase